MTAIEICEARHTAALQVHSRPIPRWFRFHSARTLRLASRFTLDNVFYGVLIRTNKRATVLLIKYIINNRIGRRAHSIFRFPGLPPAGFRAGPTSIAWLMFRWRSNGLPTSTIRKRCVLIRTPWRISSSSSSGRMSFGKLHVLIGDHQAQSARIPE
jgi:hypothetical protein